MLEFSIVVVVVVVVAVVELLLPLSRARITLRSFLHLFCFCLSLSSFFLLLLLWLMVNPFLVWHKKALREYDRSPLPWFDKYIFQRKLLWRSFFPVRGTTTFSGVYLDETDISVTLFVRSCYSKLICIHFLDTKAIKLRFIVK